MNHKDLIYARRAKRYGMQNSLRIVIEAKRASIPISLGFALAEQETGKAINEFGHDPTRSIPDSWKGTTVTRTKYRYYKAHRRFGYQGVGPLQLTWGPTQDVADRLGGCYKPAYNFRVGFATLAALIKTYGMWAGVSRYNGAGSAARAYANSVISRMHKWHRRLT